MALKVVIAEDNDLFRSAIGQVLISQGDRYEMVGEAANGVEAVDLVEKYIPNLLILDLQMPELDGFAVMETIRDRYPKLKIVVLSMSHSSENLKKALQYGADAYCTKTDGRDGFLKALDYVRTGKPYFSSDVTGS